jgi:AcrR family transcriptional regulator
VELTAERDVPQRVAARRDATRTQILDAAWELAHEVGLTGFSLRELAGRVGMRAPSLYEYFSGKTAIYDAMFADGNRAFLAATTAAVPPGSTARLRDALRAAAHAYLAFASEDPARFQLLFQRAIADWEPSPTAYAPAEEAYAHMRTELARYGIDDQRQLDLWTALVSGLAHQQAANDPGGTRWHGLVDDVVELFVHHLGVSGDTTPSDPSDTTSDHPDDATTDDPDDTATTGSTGDGHP